MSVMSPGYKEGYSIVKPNEFFVLKILKISSVVQIFNTQNQIR